MSAPTVQCIDSLGRDQTSIQEERPSLVLIPNLQENEASLTLGPILRSVVGKATVNCYDTSDVKTNHFIHTAMGEVIPSNQM